MEHGGDFSALRAKMGSLGLSGLLIGEPSGGSAGSLSDAAIVFEELGRGLVPGPLLSTSVLAALIVEAAGNDTLLRRIADGSQVLALAFTELDGLWDASTLRVAAVPAANGYEIHGAKHFVMDADIATELIVVARSVANGDLVVALVPRGAAGVTVNQMRGWNGEPVFEVGFDHVPVEQGAILAAGPDASNILSPAFERATALLCAYMSGACERVYEIAFRYAHTRRQFGQAIARFQRVQDHLIDMRNEADRTRCAALQAIEELESGAETATRSVSLAKVIASEAFMFCCEASHHIHGGIGSDRNYGLYLYTKAAQTCFHYLGAPAYHETRIARALCL
jgi:alkylation response protein AidB-like acyl-CoA dehydrogenase